MTHITDVPIRHKGKAVKTGALAGISKSDSRLSIANLSIAFIALVIGGAAVYCRALSEAVFWNSLPGSAIMPC